MTKEKKIHCVKTTPWNNRDKHILDLFAGKIPDFHRTNVESQGEHCEYRTMTTSPTAFAVTLRGGTHSSANARSDELSSGKSCGR